MRTILSVLTLLVCCCHSNAQRLNGFELNGALIPVKDIMRGGPPRDGIPSIDNPKFQPLSTYEEFNDKTSVLGVYHNGVAKAYPINIMDWHEVVNDDFNGSPVVVTYCPLCGSGIAFKADIDQGKAVEFGVSGLLYNSDVLLYDRATESLWSQIMGQAVSGPLKGQELEPLITQRTTLRAWKKLYPQTLVLTTETGFHRNYQNSPYGNYEGENRTYFPVNNQDDRMHKKEWVIGVENNGSYKAYPIDHLSKLPGQKLTDKLGGETIEISWDRDVQNILVKNSSGKELPGLQMFWFAWVAFNPETEIFE